MPILFHGDGEKVPTAEDIGALPLTGGKMSGTVDMGNQKIIGLGYPLTSDGAATKGYIDGKYSRKKVASNTMTFSPPYGLVVVSVWNFTGTEILNYGISLFGFWDKKVLELCHVGENISYRVVGNDIVISASSNVNNIQRWLFPVGD